MNVSSIDNLYYSFWPGPHFLVDDDGNIVGYLSPIKELSLSEQKYTKIKNIRWYNSDCNETQK